MGWSDKAIARTRLAAAKAIATSHELVAAADKELLQSQPRYAEVKFVLATATSEARATTSRKLTEAGSTEAGARIGGATRKGLSVLAELPILSAPADAARAHHAIDVLAAHCKEEPDEPMHTVRLAEGLDRVQNDLLVYRMIRTAVDPMYLLHRQLIVTAAQLGRDASDPTRMALLKRAFVQARRRLADVHDDPSALHVLARVYLAQGDVRQASLAAALAYRSSSADPQPLITLAKCHMIATEDEKAVAVAQQAASEGALYANEILACLTLKRTDLRQSEIALEFERLRSEVTADARLAYLGCQPDAGSAWQSLKSKQTARATKLANNVKELGNGLGT